ncbi:MAG: TauD/TfdA family dioxygenase, partial [Pseudomonadota bacterium]
INPLAGTIEPRWWTGTPALDPALFTIDCRHQVLDEQVLAPDGALAKLMQQTFEKVGLVHVRNTGLTDLQMMRRVAKLVLDHEMIYTGGANPRNSLEPNVYEVGAPLQAWLHYHHEMAYIGKSTRMLGFLAYKAVPGKGQTFVSDNVQATDAIMKTAFGQKLRDLGLCYHRDLTDRDAFQGTDEIGVYNHWQKSMLTDDPDEAVRVAAERGLETEWGPNRLLKTRYYISAFEYFEPLDRNLLYSSVADDGMWFDTWPKVMHLPFDQRPLKLTFGDGTEMTRDEKQQFVDVYDNFGIPIDWQQGDVALVCNYRFAHGRPRIFLENGEERELGVLIGESYDRLQDKPEKW